MGSPLQCFLFCHCCVLLEVLKCKRRSPTRLAPIPQPGGLLPACALVSAFPCSTRFLEHFQGKSRPAVVFSGRIVPYYFTLPHEDCKISQYCYHAQQNQQFVGSSHISKSCCLQTAFSPDLNKVFPWHLAVCPSGTQKSVTGSSAFLIIKLYIENTFKSQSPQITLTQSLLVLLHNHVQLGN